MSDSAIQQTESLGTADGHVGILEDEHATPRAKPGDNPLGWHSRGYLPHCDYPGLLQSITYRLADSLPAQVVADIDHELHHMPPDQQSTERRERIDNWLDSGYGCCVLEDPAAAACVLENWHHFALVRYDLIACVIMPNHVHVLIRVYDGMSLSRIVKSWKGYTSRHIRAMMAGRIPSPVLPDKGLWRRDYWDRYIRDEHHFQAVVDYIHQNPVKAGLVDKAEDWAWSSARDWNCCSESA